MALATAALEQQYSGGPVKIVSNGMSAIETTAPGDFSDKLAELLKLGVEDLRDRFAIAIAGSLDFRRLGGGDHDSASKLVLASIAGNMAIGAIFRNALVERFDAEKYFQSVNAEMCHAALDEMGVAKDGRPKKKGEIAAFSAGHASSQSWVPAMMRF
jgi:hypothetical protein